MTNPNTTTNNTLESLTGELTIGVKRIEIHKGKAQQLEMSPVRDSK